MGPLVVGSCDGTINRHPFCLLPEEDPVQGVQCALSPYPPAPPSSLPDPAVRLTSGRKCQGMELFPGAWGIVIFAKPGETLHSRFLTLIYFCPYRACFIPLPCEGGLREWNGTGGGTYTVTCWTYTWVQKLPGEAHRQRSSPPKWLPSPDLEEIDSKWWSWERKGSREGIEKKKHKGE